MLLGYAYVLMNNKVHSISWTIPHCVLVLKLIGNTLIQFAHEVNVHTSLHHNTLFKYTMYVLLIDGVPLTFTIGRVLFNNCALG